MTRSKRFRASLGITRQEKRTTRRMSFEPLEGRMLLDASAVITEFLAINNDGVVDDDGDYSDWIEIHNPTDATVDLDNWSLTDDQDDLDQWRFPSVSLQPGEYLHLFASGKDRVDPAGELHTNFKLDGDGEYLALVRPGGVSIASQFAPDGKDDPRQFENVSYGLRQGAEVTTLVAEAAGADILIPVDDSLATTWTEAGFVGDASWTAGPTGVGFEIDNAAGNAAVQSAEGGTPLLRLDINDRSGEAGTADTEAGFTMFDIGTNGQTFDGVTVTLSAIGGAYLDDRDRTTPVDNPPDFTEDQLYDDFIFAAGTVDGAGMQVLVEGLSPGTMYQVKLWSFDTGSTGTRVSNWVETSGPQPVPIELGYSFDGSDSPNANDDYTMTALLTANDAGQLRIRGTRNGGTSHGVFLNAIEIVTPGYGGVLRTDLEPVMHQQNASAYVRIPFEVEADAQFDLLTFKMLYDAGFVAYLNGQEVARRGAVGAPGTPLPFDAAATGERTLEESLTYEAFNLTSRLDLLNKGGPNVLAIHGLNSDAADDDFLILPELQATSLQGGGSRYFLAPTPAEPNGAGLLGFVSDTRFSVDRGF